MFSKIKNKRGMTLIEIMIVLAILGGIAALLLPRFTGSLDKAKTREAKIQIGQIMSSLAMYYTDCGRYPAALTGLSEADGNCSNWGPEAYSKPKQLKDPWGNDFDYQLNGGNFVITSLGKDGSPGGSGYDSDISSEDME